MEEAADFRGQTDLSHHVIVPGGDGLEHTLSENCLLLKAVDESVDGSDPQRAWEVWKGKHDQEEERRLGVRQRASYGSNIAILGWIGFLTGLTWLAFLVFLSSLH